jgi:hypothetical protein
MKNKWEKGAGFLNVPGNGSRQNEEEVETNASYIV